MKSEEDYSLNTKNDKGEAQKEAVVIQEKKVVEAEAEKKAVQLQKIENWDRAKAGEGDVRKEEVRYNLGLRIWAKRAVLEVEIAKRGADEAREERSDDVVLILS